MAGAEFGLIYSLLLKLDWIEIDWRHSIKWNSTNAAINQTRIRSSSYEWNNQSVIKIEHVNEKVDLLQEA